MFTVSVKIKRIKKKLGQEVLERLNHSPGGMSSGNVSVSKVRYSLVRMVL